MTRQATLAPMPLAAFQGGAARPAIARLLGATPTRVELARTHFPGRRPVQMQFIAHLPGGAATEILAEYCPGTAEARAEEVAASLRKSRNGQRAALEHRDRAGLALLADEETGLVLRRPGLDERLPALRLLHDPASARQELTRLMGRDPGPVRTRLLAHRLGKRAVLRLDLAEGPVYARLRAIKSGEGQSRYARHAALWRALPPDGALRIPEPLGELPDLGLSLFGALAGTPPDFARSGGSQEGPVLSALSALQALDLPDLPIHAGAEEARILDDWHTRIRDHRPEIASVLTDPLARLCGRLRAGDTSRQVLLPTHRDLHPKQILIAGHRAGLLDFDTLARGPGALDAGNLIAHVVLDHLDPGPLARALAQPGLDLWRRAALARLAMIYAMTSTPDTTLLRLVREASCDDRD